MKHAILNSLFVLLLFWLSTTHLIKLVNIIRSINSPVFVQYCLKSGVKASINARQNATVEHKCREEPLSHVVSILFRNFYLNISRLDMTMYALWETSCSKLVSVDLKKKSPPVNYIGDIHVQLKVFTKQFKQV